MTNLNPRVENSRLILSERLHERSVTGQDRGIHCLRKGSLAASLQLKLGLAKTVSIGGEDYILNVKSLDKWLARTTENFGRDTISHFDTKTHGFIRDAIRDSSFSLEDIIKNHVKAQTQSNRVQAREGALSKERMISLFEDEAKAAQTFEVPPRLAQKVRAPKRATAQEITLRLEQAQARREGILAHKKDLARQENLKAKEKFETFRKRPLMPSLTTKSAWTVSGAEVLKGKALSPKSLARAAANLASQQLKLVIANSPAWTRVSGAEIIQGAHSPQTESRKLKEAKERFQTAGRKVIGLVKATKAFKLSGADFKIKREKDLKKQEEIRSQMKAEVVYPSFAQALSRPQTEKEFRADHLAQIRGAINSDRRKRIQHAALVKSQGQAKVVFDDAMKAALKDKVIQGHKNTAMNELMRKKRKVLSPSEPKMLSKLNKRLEVQNAKLLAEGKKTLSEKIKADHASRTERPTGLNRVFQVLTGGYFS